MFRQRRIYNGQSFTHPHRLRHWVSTHKKIAIPGAIVLVLLLSGTAFAIYKATSKKSTTPVAKHETKTPEAPAAPPKYYSPLTGLEVPQDKLTRPVTAIMIENSPDARPQSGLAEAGVVFEAIAEGGITRFAVLYHESSPQKIGPVRSLRMYYVDWIAAFNPSIAHIGGSAKALKTVRSNGFKDIDQFFNPQGYWRVTDRYAPHNLYSSFDKLDALNKKKGYYTPAQFTGFERKAEEPPTAPNATKIQVKISGPWYNSTYTYDKPSNSYLRSHQVGGNHIDRETKQQLHPKVVVVMKVKEVTVLEDGYRQSIEAVGSGEVTVFQDGTATKGTWSKAAQKDQIVFKKDDGSPLKLNPGQTWVTAIPKNQSVTWQP